MTRIREKNISCSYVYFSSGLPTWDTLCKTEVSYNGLVSPIKVICPDACKLYSREPTKPLNKVATKSPLCPDDQKFVTRISEKNISCSYVYFSSDLPTLDTLCKTKVNYNGSDRPIKAICPDACKFDCKVPNTQAPTIPAPTNSALTTPFTLAPSSQNAGCSQIPNQVDPSGIAIQSGWVKYRSAIARSTMVQTESCGNILDFSCRQNILFGVRVADLEAEKKTPLNPFRFLLTTDEPIRGNVLLQRYLMAK